MWFDDVSVLEIVLAVHTGALDDTFVKQDDFVQGLAGFSPSLPPIDVYDFVEGGSAV